MLMLPTPALAADAQVNWRKVAIAPTVVGALGVLGGAGVLVAGYLQPSATLQLAGWSSLGAGLALIAAGAALCALGGSPAKAGLLSFFVTPQGAAIAFTRAW